MSRELISNLTVAGVLLSLLYQPARAEWQNSLNPKGTPAGEFVFARDGKAACAVQLPAEPTPQERTAAAMAFQWASLISGAQLGWGTADDGPVVRIATDASLGSEGYRIAIESDDLVLAGGPGRGVINAVIALFEEDLGVRFYTPESMRWPTAPTLVVQPVSRTYAPKLRLRDPFYAAAFHSQWSVRNRTDAPRAVVPEELGGHMDYGGYFVHTAASLLPAGEYFAAHPEYFWLDAAGKRTPAQWCSTEPEVLKIVAAKVLEALRANPRTEIISVSKNDNAGDQICHCDRCKKLREAEGGSDMACQLVVVNGVAEAVEKEFPNVVIDTLAYLETINVPKTMRPRKNVAIRFCNDRVGAWSKPFMPAAECQAAAVAKAWSAAHDRIHVWDYTVNFSHYLAPMPNIDVMAANIRFWVENDSESVMLQGGYQGVSEADEMKSWVAAKLLWDPSLDERTLVQDFIWGHYGNAAPAIAEYQTLLESLRTAHAAVMAAPPLGIRYPMEAAFYSKDFLDKATVIFTRAKQLAEKDPTILRRVERAQLPVLYVQCTRGPEFTGEGYATAVADFERIAGEHGVTYLKEWFAPKQQIKAELNTIVASWKKRIASGK